MSSKDNPHSVSSILASTPRSKGKKSRKRRLHTADLESQGAVAAAATAAVEEDESQPCIKDSVLSKFIKIADTIPDIKYRLLDLSQGTQASESLKVTPATCTVTQLGPMDVIRLLVSATSGLCQYQVMYPVPRCVDQLKCESVWWAINRIIILNFVLKPPS